MENKWTEEGITIKMALIIAQIKKTPSRLINDHRNFYFLISTLNCQVPQKNTTEKIPKDRIGIL